MQQLRTLALTFAGRTARPYTPVYFEARSEDIFTDAEGETAARPTVDDAGSAALGFVGELVDRLRPITVIR